MICSRCGKNPASVFFKQVVDSRLTEFSLCASCAEASELAAAPPPLLGLLGKLVFPRPAAQPACPACGLRWSEFRRTGRLGCAGCYEAFARPLSGLLRRVHGAQRHSGKAPRPAGADGRGPAQESAETASRLKELLRAAVRAERFEEAARLRDRLKSLEG